MTLRASVRTRLTPVRERTYDAVAPRRAGVALVGLVLVAVGTFSPWANFSGFPGKLKAAGFPAGGARLYSLVLGVAGVLVLTRVAGRRGAALIGSLGCLAVAGFNLLAVARDVRGGIGFVAYGCWLTVAGALLLVMAAGSLPQDVALAPFRRRPAWVELLVVAFGLGGLLALVVIGLDVTASSQFISYLALLGFGATALARVGLFSWFSTVFERHRTIAVSAACLTAVVFPFTQGGDAYWIRVGASIGVFATAAIGLNVVVGLAGLLDLGYVAFFGVGAYVGALFANASLTTVHVHLPFLVVMLMGGAIAAVFGVLIGAPTLRLRGDYLAIVTLGFGEIFRIAAQNFDGQAGPNLTRGPNGIAGIPNLGLPGGFEFGAAHEVFGVSLPAFANYLFAELLLLLAVAVVFVRLNNSRVGRGWVAIREDETAAEAMGVNTVRLKLLAFAIGAFLAGVAGTLNAHVVTQVSPDSYTFLESIFLLAAVVLGGMGTVGGALLGSTALFVIPEKLRAFADKRILFFGLALVVMMRFRPEGLIASRRRAAEFHEAEEEANIVPAAAPPAATTGGA